MGQTDGLTRILNEWDRRALSDLRWLAYMLATAFHETATTMQPIRELGGEAYLKTKPYYPWVGEGLVQVTWESNARKFGATAPGQLMAWPLCLQPLFDGMISGMFTGKMLLDYFNATLDDPVGARRIINGVDQANLVAHYHGIFLGALLKAKLSSIAPVPPPPVGTAPMAPRPIPAKPIGLLAAILNILAILFKRKATP